MPDIVETAPTGDIAPADQAPAPKPEETKRPSVRSSVEAAMKQVDADPAFARASDDDREALSMLRGEPVQRDKPGEPEPPAVKRAANGKFAAADGRAAEAEKPAPDKPVEPSKAPAPDKAPTAAADDDAPPSRFNGEAKEAWKAAPPAVKAEVRRAIAEMEKGIEQYRERASNLDGLDELEQFAAQAGTTPNQTIKQLWQANKLLQQDLVGGMDVIARTFGKSLHEVASQVLGREPNQNLSAAEQAIGQRDQYIQRLEAEVGQYRQQTQRTAETEVSSEIARFMQDNPAAEPMRQKMAALIRNGVADDLSEAFHLARVARGIPSSPSAPAAPAPDQPRDFAAQTRKGALSVSGAPSAGSHPGYKPALSVREAAERAMRATGLL